MNTGFLCVGNTHVTKVHYHMTCKSDFLFRVKEKFHESKHVLKSIKFNTICGKAQHVKKRGKILNTY